MLPPELDTPRRLLVPFAGSGSELIGARLAGWEQITGIELNPVYVHIARQRLAWWAQFATYEAAKAHFDADRAKAQQRQIERAVGVEQLSLFATQKGADA